MLPDVLYQFRQDLSAHRPVSNSGRVPTEQVLDDIRPFLGNYVQKGAKARIEAPPFRCEIEAPRVIVYRAIAALVADAFASCGLETSVVVRMANTLIQPDRDERVSHMSGGRYILIEVKDDGPGIPQETLERITMDGYSPAGQGSSLGFVLEAARLSGGHVVVDSSPQGTSISMFLPCATH